MRRTPEGEPIGMGPILSQLAHVTPSVLVLLGIRGADSRLQEVAAQVREQHAAVEVIEQPDALDGQLSFVELLARLRCLVGEWHSRDPEGAWRVLPPVDWPTLYGCWLYLASQGNLPIEIIQEAAVAEDDGFAWIEPDGVRQAFLAEKPARRLEDVARRMGCIGQDPKYLHAVEQTALFAESDTPVVFMGEPGSGRELLARLLHQLSSRRGHRMVTLCCGALPHATAEAVVFGAGLGSGEATPGSRLHLAEGGILYLHELAELPAPLQVRLTHFLDHRSKGGELAAKLPSVRLVASVSPTLSSEDGERRLREELWRSLRSGKVTVPSLRERPGDLPLLAQHFLSRINASLAAPKQLSPEALGELASMSWPHNLRDLYATIERAAVLTPKTILSAEDLRAQCSTLEPYPVQGPPVPVLDGSFSLEMYLSTLRRRIILKALEKANHNQSLAARMLGITPQAVHQFVKTHVREESE